mmetsp:Transcript_95035/g.188268  ORF Transcript_95035/g.188268 Transcript_95035/m.188268 type:complete len:960 (-) Transcript_95035:85-2964(-)
MSERFHYDVNEDPDNKPFEQGGENDISRGPLPNRTCTDVVCLVTFLIHWLVFVIVACIGFAEGDVSKLYRPRDFRGGYCGLSADGFVGHHKLVHMMNTTATVDSVAKQLVCSTAAQNALAAMWGTGSNEWEQYVCACCLEPCASCKKGLGLPDLTNPADLRSFISSRMLEFTDPMKAASLFSPTGSNAAADFDPSSLLKEMTKYFVPICIYDCVQPFSKFYNNTASTGMRQYTYRPTLETPWRKAWDQLAKRVPAGMEAIKTTLEASFTFRAMPRNQCPYDAKYCVPMPGVSFTTDLGDYCFVKIDRSVQNSLGLSSAMVLEGLGKASMMDGEVGNFDAAAGSFMSTLDALAVISFWGFITGMVFMVLLRFFVGIVVWSALLSVTLLMLFGGAAAYTRSHQCLGAGLFATGKQSAVAAASVAEAISKQIYEIPVSESLTGNGSDYRGRQHRTRSGKNCQRWDCQSTASCIHGNSFTSQKYPTADLLDNYCRNPGGVAASIWCFTEEPDVTWELCSPIGVIKPVCHEGYEVNPASSRKALEICSYIVFSVAGLWILIIWCLRNRIALAIAVTKAAAMFIYHTPIILLVPVVQIILGCLYNIGWFSCAAFMVTQVPDSYMPKDYYATWAEADVACTSKWPEGFVFRDGGALNITGHPCSDNVAVPRCWRCAPPRMSVTGPFVYSFFSLLWNNAFGVACGQCIIAGTVALWFFTPHAEKRSKGGVISSVKRTLRYHSGSLALGAFILAVVQMIRYACLYFQKQAEAQNNKVMKLVLKCIQCCIWCFEKFVQFLNKNAYIQVAIMGTPFCTSAKTAFFIILRNVLRFGTFAALGSIIHFIGFAFIMVATTVLGYFILQALHPDVSPVLPVLSYFAVSYLIAKLYMNVFGLTVDTMLQCFIAAEEMKNTRAYVPKPLLRLLPTESLGKKMPRNDGDLRSAKVAPDEEEDIKDPVICAVPPETQK